METIPATTTQQVFSVFWEYTGIEGGQCTETGFSSHFAAQQYIADHAEASEAANGTTIKNVHIFETSHGIKNIIKAANDVLPFLLRHYDASGESEFSELTNTLNYRVLSPAHPISYQDAQVNFICMPDCTNPTKRYETFLRFQFAMVIDDRNGKSNTTQTIYTNYLYQYNVIDRKFWRVNV